MRALRKVKIKWSPDFAYAIGLLTTDGSLSSDGRHMNLTSKDRGLIEIFKTCLGLKNKIGRKMRKGGGEKRYFQLQFGDVYFYRFLLKLGLTPNKSKTLSEIYIPKQYFFDFLRGHFDGDGTFYSYWDPRWKSSFMFYTVFTSASRSHILWLRRKIREQLSINGHITKDKNKTLYQLKYAKWESLKLLEKLYVHSRVYLPRKYLKITKALAIIGKHI